MNYVDLFGVNLHDNEGQQQGNDEQCIEQDEPEEGEHQIDGENQSASMSTLIYNSRTFEFNSTYYDKSVT